MIAYSVLEPAEVAETAIERADRIVFVREGFAVFALLFPLLWLLVHRMWWVLIGFAVILAAVNAGATLMGLGETATSLALLVLTLFFALNANELRRWTLERRGYQVVGAVSGRNRDECEIRFFADWDGADEAPADSLTTGESDEERAGG